MTTEVKLLKNGEYIAYLRVADRSKTIVKACIGSSEQNAVDKLNLNKIDIYG